jgi:DNA polymerase III epsilon subunit-like protein
MLPASRFLSFDTETTGYGTTARIVEIGCVLFENGEPIEKWSSLIRPIGIDWEDERVKAALEVTKLSPEEIDKAPTLPQVFHKLFVLLRSARVWVCHNAQFDLRMFNNEFQIYKGSVFPLQPQEGVLCTLALSRALTPRVKGHTLEAVAARWNVPVDGSHRASSDALTCGRILNAMAKERLPADVGWVHERKQQEPEGRGLWG